MLISYKKIKRSKLQTKFLTISVLKDKINKNIITKIKKKKNKTL